MAYLGYVIACRLIWSRRDSTDVVPDTLPPATVVVVARDESEHIEKCLSAIASNHANYRSLSIILVDDHSTDDTVEIAESLEIPYLTVLRLENFDQLDHYEGKYKKAALHYALSVANSDVIMTTDADCWMSDQWVLATVCRLSRGGHRALTGRVAIIGEESLLSAFQTIEMMGTMAGTKLGMTTGLYQSANAANMIFYRSDYLDFLKESEHRHASGDDIFFAQWLVHSGRTIGYNDNATCTVTTPAETTLDDLTRQRIRWATKTTSYDSIGTKVLMGGLFIFHLSVIFNLIVGLCFAKMMLLFGLVQLLLKLIFDYRLLTTVARDSGYIIPKALYPVLGLMHVIYISMMGLFGLTVRRYQWKGRSVQ